jgi:hypothetical protein
VETVKRHPVIAYFVLAYVLTWWMFPLLRSSPLLGLFGLFGPALAAIIMAGVLDGRSGVKALLKRGGALAGLGCADTWSRLDCLRCWRWQRPDWPSCWARRRRSRWAHCRASTS